jgi:hypothetical protein
MINFDRYIGIDWTGAKTPILNNSIAVAECLKGQKSPHLIKGPWSRDKVARFIETKLEVSDRTLIGIDCNFGYAASILHEQLGQDSTAFDLWHKVNSLNVDQPNFFAGKFWSHHEFRKYFWTEGKMPVGFAMPRRVTEQVCGESGHGWPESPFKMIGAKQVGKGGLAGMRLAHNLKLKHGDKIAIWPFDPPLLWNKARIIITEIYPRQFIRRAGYGHKKLRHIGELNSALATLGSSPVKNMIITDHDTDALIAAAGLRYLCGAADNIPDALANPPAKRETLACEGWIFGAGYN